MCRPIEKKENQFSFEPPSCAKAEFTERKTDDAVSIREVGFFFDDDNDSCDYGSLLRSKVEKDIPKKVEVIIIDSDDDDDSCDRNHCLIGTSDFENKFWSASVKKIDANCNSTEDLEKKNMIREDSTHFGSRYGRTKSEACQVQYYENIVILNLKTSDINSCNAFFVFGKKIFEHTNLKKDEIFIDIGHGIGNAVLQAALTIGCNSRGLELNRDRFLLSKEFQNCAKEFLDQERVSFASTYAVLLHARF